MRSSLSFLVSLLLVAVLGWALTLTANMVWAKEPTLVQVMEERLDEIPALRSEGVSFVPTSGPFKGQVASAEDVLSLTGYELRELGVNLKKGRWVHQVCHYYSTDGSPDPNSPTNPVVGSVCEQKQITLMKAPRAALCVELTAVSTLERRAAQLLDQIPLGAGELEVRRPLDVVEQGEERDPVLAGQLRAGQLGLGRVTERPRDGGIGDGARNRGAYLWHKMGPRVAVEPERSKPSPPP